MAVLAIHSVMSSEHAARQLHPFFSRIQDAHKIRRDETQIGGESTTTHGEPQAVGIAAQPQRAAKEEAPQNELPTTAFMSGVSSAREDAEHADLELDSNDSRRKRRRTTFPHQIINDPNSGPAVTGPDWRAQLEAEVGVAGEDVHNAKGPPPSTDLQASDVAAVSAPTAQTYQNRAPSRAPSDRSLRSSTHAAPTSTDKPVRTLRLSGGKFASPRGIKPAEAPRKARSVKKQAAERRLIVVIPYTQFASDVQAFAAKVQNILCGSERCVKAEASPQDNVQKVQRCGTPKPTHPFFLGKPSPPFYGKSLPPKQNDEKPTRADKTDSFHLRASATTPGKLRAQRDALRASKSSSSPPRPRQAKQRDVYHPAWPYRDTAHVRGLDAVRGFEAAQPAGPGEAGFARKSQKCKLIDASTNVPGELRFLRATPYTNENLPPDENLAPIRKPRRRIMSGLSLQKEIGHQISSSFSFSIPSSLPGHSSSPSPLARPHAALARLERTIAAELTAFDKFQCETQMWTTKYAPSTVAEVLQLGPEALVLRDWLQRSTISAVHTGSNRSAASSTMFSKIARQETSSKMARQEKKRKRRDDDVDDFIVSSDDELDGLDDARELRPLTSSEHCSRPIHLRSLARGGEEYEKAVPGSTILLSGPSGCGKTAAVYAVANELGFEIFEINSASRRSGKDILEKIGDMTENHLVQQVSKALMDDDVAQGKTEAIHIDWRETPNQQQKNMGSFFKPKLTAAPLLKTATKPTRTKQRQSLILLEEVDVLFEEDKGFWMTVLTLASHSRRPIVMTCNDERYVPESLTLHAILRFVPPPLELAADYLLLLAAREGHLLQRRAVEYLYNSRQDLRATITQLNLWCQMSVGDPTHGFHWMIDRYPPGCDLDPAGRVLRVVSERTLEEGMGVISHDLATVPAMSREVEEALWSDAWAEHATQLDLCEDLAEGAANNLNLNDWTFALDIASAGDISFGNCMRPFQDQRLDSTLPPLMNGAVADYCLGLSGSQDVLQAAPRLDYMSLDMGLAITSRLLLSHIISASQAAKPQSVPQSIMAAVQRPLTDLSTKTLRRSDFSTALDPLATDPEDSPAGVNILMSSFDRELQVITTDLAPYARTIALEYRRREEERLQLSNLLSLGGKKRNTRSAYTALEGGARAQQRRPRYFERWRKLNVSAADVLATAGEGWLARSMQDAVGEPVNSTRNPSHSP